MIEKAVVISGAAKGIGRATALCLAAQGFHVFAGVRKLSDGDALRQEAGKNLTPLLLDITDEPQVAAAAATVDALVGAHGVVGLVNNAGIAVAAPLEFVPLAALRHQLEINVIGQIGVTQAFLPLLRQAQGRIINISSLAGRVAGPMTGPYHASKFALEALTDTLRQELTPWGIAVVSIQPGVIATPLWETSLAQARQLIATFPPRAQTLYGDQIQQRLTQSTQNLEQGTAPEEVAIAILQALTAKRPHTRYQVGTDAKLAVNLVARLPDRWRDWVIAKAQGGG